MGAGFMAAIDEIVFHLLLQWHHFYDRSTPTIGIFSDGLLHAAQLVAIVAGFFLAADLLSKSRFARAFWGAGLFLGLGAFQLFDGLVNHKVLRVHQVRYDVPLLPYDVWWNLAGLALIVIGLFAWRRAHVSAA